MVSINSNLMMVSTTWFKNSSVKGKEEPRRTEDLLLF